MARLPADPLPLPPDRYPRLLRTMPKFPSAPALSAPKGFAICVVLVGAIKGIAWLIDPNVRLFMGDSGSYFHTALTGWIPPDRSFLYGWLIGATAIPTRSIDTLLLLQTTFGVLSSLLLYAWLAFGVRIRPTIAITVAALFALEPAQLFYERMMMAEATGFLAFALFFASMSAYVVRGHWHWIPVYAVFGVLAVALRISLMPVVLVLSLIAPFARAMGAHARGSRVQRIAVLATIEFTLAAVCTLYVHDYYKRWYGELAESAPGYTANAGIFRLALVAPLVEGRHFRNSGVSPEVLREVTIDYRDPRQREAQVWMEGGLYDVLRRHTHDPETAARKISIKAARDNPFGLVKLGLLTVADYFEPAISNYRLQDDTGRRGANPQMIDDLKKHLRYDATELHQANTPALRWFVLGSGWLTACLFLLAPLAVVALWRGWNAPRRELRVLLALASLGLVTGHVLFSHIVSFRYLHPLPWFVLANAAVLAALLREPRSINGRDETPSSANSHS